MYMSTKWQEITVVRVSLPLLLPPSIPSFPSSSLAPFSSSLFRILLPSPFTSSFRINPAMGLGEVL